MGERATPPEDYWLKLAEVRARTTLGTSTIYKMMAEGTFPRPAKLGARCVRWRTSWIAEWETTRPGVAEHPRASEVTRVETVVRPPAAVASSPAASRRQPRSRRHTWEPLTMTWEEVADRVFRRDAAWLRGNLPPDFPQPDPVYGLFHAEAVETWTRRRWGIVAAAQSREEALADAEAVLLARVGAHGPPNTRSAGAAGVAPDDERLNYSVSQLANRWNCSPDKVRSLLATGALPHFRVGTLMRVRAADVRAHEEKCRVETRSRDGATSPGGAFMTAHRSGGFMQGVESTRRSLARKKTP